MVVNALAFVLGRRGTWHPCRAAEVAAWANYAKVLLLSV